LISKVNQIERCPTYRRSHYLSSSIK